jgi:DNA-binding Lrp family transcriptional regulator
MKLDDKDILILQVLRGDSRSSVREIAKITNLRPSTVHVRITNLVKSGVIEKFTLKLNNKAFGENFIVFVLIKSSGEIRKQVFLDKHVHEAFGITGEYDLMLKCKFADIEEFNNFLLNFRKENNIISTVTMVSTVTIKEEI